MTSRKLVLVIKYPRIKLTRNGKKTKFGVGDFVHAIADGHDPYIARITELGEDAKGTFFANLQWCYRLSELPIAKPADAVRNEVFICHHHDYNPVECILEGIRVQFKNDVTGEVFLNRLYADEEDIDLSLVQPQYVCHREYDTRKDVIISMSSKDFDEMKSLYSSPQQRKEKPIRQKKTEKKQQKVEQKNNDQETSTSDNAAATATTTIVPPQPHVQMKNVKADAEENDSNVQERSKAVNLAISSDLNGTTTKAEERQTATTITTSVKPTTAASSSTAKPVESPLKPAAAAAAAAANDNNPNKTSKTGAEPAKKDIVTASAKDKSVKAPVKTKPTAPILPPPSSSSSRDAPPLSVGPDVTFTEPPVSQPNSNPPPSQQQQTQQQNIASTKGTTGVLVVVPPAKSKVEQPASSQSQTSTVRPAKSKTEIAKLVVHALECIAKPKACDREGCEEVQTIMAHERRLGSNPCPKSPKCKSCNAFQGYVTLHEKGCGESCVYPNCPYFARLLKHASKQCAEDNCYMCWFFEKMAQLHKCTSAQCLFPKCSRMALKSMIDATKRRSQQVVVPAAASTATSTTSATATASSDSIASKPMPNPTPSTETATSTSSITIASSKPDFPDSGIVITKVPSGPQQWMKPRKSVRLVSPNDLARRRGHERDSPTPPAASLKLMPIRVRIGTDYQAVIPVCAPPRMQRKPANDQVLFSPYAVSKAFDSHVNRFIEEEIRSKLAQRGSVIPFRFEGDMARRLGYVQKRAMFWCRIAEPLQPHSVQIRATPIDVTWPSTAAPSSFTVKNTRSLMYFPVDNVVAADSLMEEAILNAFARRPNGTTQATTTIRTSVRGLSDVIESWTMREFDSFSIALNGLTLSSANTFPQLFRLLKPSLSIQKSSKDVAELYWECPPGLRDAPLGMGMVVCSRCRAHRVTCAMVVCTRFFNCESAMCESCFTLDGSNEWFANESDMDISVDHHHNATETLFERTRRSRAFCKQCHLLSLPGQSVDLPQELPSGITASAEVALDENQQQSKKRNVSEMTESATDNQPVIVQPSKKKRLVVMMDDEEEDEGAPAHKPAPQESLISSTDQFIAQVLARYDQNELNSKDAIEMVRSRLLDDARNVLSLLGLN